MDTVNKLSQMLFVVASFFILLAIVFWAASKARGKAQQPLAWVIFLGPALALLLIGLVVPAVITFFASFQNASSKKWVGLENYGWIFTTPDNKQMLINTVLWIIVTPIASTLLGLTLALLLDRMRRESIPEPVGLLQAVVTKLGWSDPPNWILWEPWNNFLLMIIMIWIQTGFAMVVLSAAIKAIPMDVTEAAMLDGATGWKLFRRVTVPMIRGTLVVVLTTIAIGVLKVFDIVRTMTNGNYGTQVVANEMYAQSFVQFNAGRGSALAVVLFAAVIPLIVYNVSQLRKERAIR